MKIVFLDLDGVLNNYRLRWDFGKDAIDPACVDCLVSILNETGAKLVITSNWRLGHVNVDSFKHVFAGFMRLSGVRDSAATIVLDAIVGLTLDFGARADEIRDWIDANGIVDFAVLDDEAIDLGPNYFWNFFQTSDRLGLTMAIAADVIRHLKD